MWSMRLDGPFSLTGSATTCTTCPVRWRSFTSSVRCCSPPARCGTRGSRCAQPPSAYSLLASPCSESSRWSVCSRFAALLHEVRRSLVQSGHQRQPPGRMWCRLRPLFVRSAQIAAMGAVLPELVGVNLAVGGEPGGADDAGRVQQLGPHHFGIELELRN